MAKQDEKFLERVGYNRIKRKKIPPHKNAFPNLKVSDNGLSNNLAAISFKKDILHQHLWKKGMEEKKEVQEEIIAKSKRIGITFNKGGYQYITSEEMAKNLGKK